MDVEHLSSATRAGELAMLMLRLSTGITLSEFFDRTGHDPRQLFADVVERYAGNGLLHVSDASIQLTESGLPVADALAGEFLTAARREDG